MFIKMGSIMLYNTILLVQRNPHILDKYIISPFFSVFFHNEFSQLTTRILWHNIQYSTCFGVKEILTIETNINSTFLLSFFLMRKFSVYLGIIYIFRRTQLYRRNEYSQNTILEFPTYNKILFVTKHILTF